MTRTVDFQNIKRETEIQFLASKSSKHIIKLLQYAQSSKYGYLILEYAPNDNLFFYIDPSEAFQKIWLFDFLTKQF